MQNHEGGLSTLAVLLTVILIASMPATASIDAETSESSIDWYSYEEGMQRAKENNKPVFIDFMTDYCGACQRMENETYTDQRVQDKTDEIIFIKVDAQERSDLAKEYEIRYVPTLIFKDAEGKQVNRVTGFMGASELVDRLNDLTNGTQNDDEDSLNDKRSFWEKPLIWIILGSFVTAAVIIVFVKQVRENT